MESNKNIAQQNMAFLSFILGIISLVMLLFGFGLPVGALGLIVALLSKGDGPLLPKARTGFILSLIGLIISLVITVSSIVLIRSGVLQDAYDQMRELIETTYDEDETDELMKLIDQLERR